MVSAAPRPETAPVLAVLVCHDGAEWLPDVLAALRGLTVRPRHVVAVDTGSSDRSADLLAEASDVVDTVLTTSRDSGFGAAVAEASRYAAGHWDDHGEWLWLLHDDAAPEPDCLKNLLRVVDSDSSAAVLGPLGLDWDDPRLVMDAGLSLDAAGNSHNGTGLSEVDPALVSPGAAQVSEVLAVSSACCLVRWDVFEDLSGFAPDLPLVRDDIDLGWRANAAGHLVLLVPGARMRHVAALRNGNRQLDALRGERARVADRVHGVRTYLVNMSLLSFVLGVPRLLLVALLRACGFALLRRMPEASAELIVAGRLLTTGPKLLRIRRRAVTSGGLVTSRITRLREAVSGTFAWLVRERIRRDVALGHPPDVRRLSPGTRADPLPDDALDKRQRGTAGRRRSAGLVVVPVAPAPERPSPTPRGPLPDLLLVPMTPARDLRELLLTPPVVLTAVLVVFALITNGLLAEMPRFGAGLHGGRLLPAADLTTTWSDYLASWHPVNGGTGSPAPVSLLVLALLGTVLAPFGGPSAVLTVVMLFGVPLAGLSAYIASRGLPVSRTWRALVAATYALVPTATLSAVQGRADVVVAHILMPAVLAGIATVIGLSSLGPAAKPRHWLATASLTALGLAVLGAFAPLMHLVLVLLALAGFVLVPSEARRAPRRVAGMAAIVLLPVGCLLPWPVVLVSNPEILVHGLGTRTTETPAGLGMLALSPDGAAVGWLGGVLVVIAALSLVVAPCRAVLPGVLIAAAGWGTATVVGTVAIAPIGGGPATVGFTGGPLLLVACGLSWIVLVAVRKGRKWLIAPRVVAALLAGGLVVLASGSALAGRNGPLTVGGDGALPVGGTLVIGQGPARIVEGQRPHFGDDDLVPTDTAVTWLNRVQADLLSGDRDRVRSALAAAAARGTGFVAVGDGVTAAKLRELAGDLVAEPEQLPDGRRVLRVLLPSSPVQLLGPDLARHARAEPEPGPEARPLVVPATLPHVAVRVSEGGIGRLLVLGAENEPGWEAEIDGHTAPLATAWGNQVAVPLPENASEVSVTFTEIPRTTLLVLQAAAILFTLIAALPERRRPTLSD